MNELTVILPAYNEEDNIEILYKKWEDQREVLRNEHGLNLEIILVDDGSSDETAKISEEIARNNACFTLIKHSRNKGLGGAVRTGIEYFIERCQSSSYMCIMDCDNTQEPFYISDMLNSMKNKNTDIVIASRYQKGSEVEGVSKGRLLMSGGARFVFTILLGIPGVKDYTCGYRLYGRDKLDKAYTRFKDKLIEENGFTCMVELLYKLHSCNARISEIAFRLRYDQKQGVSKMSVVKTAKSSMVLAGKLRRIGRSQ